MARPKIEIDYYRNKRCPICERYSNRTHKGLALHLATSSDKLHKHWRIKNKLPSDYTHQSAVLKTASDIMKIFGWED